MANFNLTDTALKMFYPGNVAQVDDAGLPSVMVFIPKFKNSDVLAGGDDNVHPAFIVGGKEIDGFWYSKYENSAYNGMAYSLPGENPTAHVYFEDARALCEGKGHGWHISTAAEWAAIALWCKKNGHLPYGNNHYGKDTREDDFKAVPVGDGVTTSVATGTGPISWSHDNTMSGIWDMNGNLWEWQGGVRLVWGELQLLANNDAADPDNPQNQDSTLWRAINAADGSLVTPECSPYDTAPLLSGNTVRFDFTGGSWMYSTAISDAQASNRSCEFIELTCAETISDAAKALLRSLALLPDTDATVPYDGARVWINNGVKILCAYRGGSYSRGAYSSIFSVHFSANYQYRDFSLGFRASYIPGIE